MTIYLIIIRQSFQVDHSLNFIIKQNILTTNNLKTTILITYAFNFNLLFSKFVVMNI